jgi:hypothetical protein
MGTGVRWALLSAGLVCGALVPASVSAAAPGGRCSPPPRTSKVTRRVITAITCVTAEGKQLRADAIQDVHDAFPGCQNEKTSSTPKWSVVEEDGTSMIEFAQFSLPEVGAADAGVATYLHRFGHAYSGHDSHTLTSAQLSFNKAKEYTDAFAEEIAKAGEALKAHNCAGEQSSGEDAQRRADDAAQAEKEGLLALGELAG